MILGVFLAIGESFKDFRAKGQLKRLLNYNIKEYSRHFDKVYIFSYSNEREKLPENCYLIVKKEKYLHRYLYALLLPFLRKKYIEKCDLFRGLQLTGGIPALVCKLFFGKKIIINYGYDYSNFAKIEGKPFQAFLYKVIEKPITKLSDAVIVTSKETRALQGNTVYIPNGVDTKLFRPKENVENSKIIKVIYVGRIEKQKNLSNLIKAVSQIKKSIKLSFYGQGSQKSQLVKLAKHLKVDLNIYPPIDYQEVPKALKQADIFVLPSEEEGNPKALIEAMAAGLAVVGANVKGIRELILHRKTGILTDKSTNQIRKAIHSLRNAKTRSKLGKAARQFIMENFDIEKLLNEEVSLLIKTANEK